MQVAVTAKQCKSVVVCFMCNGITIIMAKCKDIVVFISCVLFCCVNLCESSSSFLDFGVIQSKTRNVDRNIYTFLNVTSGIDKLSQAYHNNISRINFKPVDGAQLAKDMAAKLSKDLKMKMDALTEAVEFAEQVAGNYTWESWLKLGDVDYVKAKEINSSDPEYVYMDMFKQKVNMNISSVHIPVEIYEGDIDILNGLNWTNYLDEIWIRNKEKYPELLWQYFGSQTGIMRNYPASKWRTDGIDLYDVRRRPWYTQGASSPKDMLILIDTSGSTEGQALHLMKESVHSLLDTLGENDFVLVVNFAKEAKIVGCFNTFVQATYRNKAKLMDYVGNLTALNMANYSKGFEFAFQQFQKFEAIMGDREDGLGANCNPIIMFLTDGGTEMPEEVFKAYNWPEKRIRIFTYAVGPTASPIAAAQWIACQNRGYFYKIPAMGAIRSTVQKYYRLTSNGLVGKLSREFLTTNTYQDFWGLGMMTTVTLPVYNRTTDSSNQTILGVMGSDVTVKDMEMLIPTKELGPNGYAFAINSNGYIVFHPHLKATKGWLDDPPNVDFLEIEYASDDKTELRKRMINEESGNQTISAYVVVDGEHADIEARTYWFTHIDLSSFSLAMVTPSYAKYYVESVEPVDLDFGFQLLENVSSAMLFDPWLICKTRPAATNDSESTEYQEFLDKINNAPFDCDNDTLQHMFFDAMVTNVMEDYWAGEEEKEDARDGIVSTFVATNGGLTRVYPASANESFMHLRDTWNAVYYKRAFDADTWQFSTPFPSDTYFNNKTGETEPTIMAYRAITLQPGDVDYKPAVVGVQMTQDRLREFVKHEFEQCRDEIEYTCYLLDDGGFLVVSTNEDEAQEVGKFFGDVDPSLMEKIYNTSVYIQKEEYDYQAACPEEQTTISSSAFRLIVPAIFDALSLNWWTTNVAWLYANFNIFSWLFYDNSRYAYGQDTTTAQPPLNSSGWVVEDEDDEPFLMVSSSEEDDVPANYSCIKHLAQYHYNHAATEPLPTETKEYAKCDGCSRQFATSKLPNSNLLLVIVHSACDVNVTYACPNTMLQAPVKTDDPHFLDGNCDYNETIRHRLQPACYDWNPNENTDECGGGSMVTPSYGVMIIFQLFSIFYILLGSTNV